MTSLSDYKVTVYEVDGVDVDLLTEIRLRAMLANLSEVIALSLKGSEPVGFSEMARRLNLPADAESPIVIELRDSEGTAVEASFAMFGAEGDELYGSCWITPLQQTDFVRSLLQRYDQMGVVEDDEAVIGMAHHAWDTAAVLRLDGMDVTVTVIAYSDADEVAYRPGTLWQDLINKMIPKKPAQPA